MPRDESISSLPPPPRLSVVAPLFDEEALVPALVARLTRVLDALGVDAEVILVDDGSRDRTFSEISRAHAADPRFRGISLSRNFGHQAAISAGLIHAKGDVVVVMDGDLQDPPEAIAPLWAKLDEGYDVVFAVRASRPEGFFKKLAYQTFYRVLGHLVSQEIPRDAGDFGIMTRRVVETINELPERRRFVRGLRAWVGFRQTGLWIDRSPRHSGAPKYTFAKLIGLALDGVIGFSGAPLRWAGGVGFAIMAIAMVVLAGAGVRLLFGSEMPAGWFWVVMMLGFSSGLQLLFLAVLGEYVLRIFHEVNGRPTYIVRRRIGTSPSRPRRRRSREQKLTHRPFGSTLS